MIEITYDHNKSLTFNGLTEAAEWVASNESLTNIYAIELAILRCLLNGTFLDNKYKIKIIEED